MAAIKLRSQLITEEWVYIHSWLASNPGNYGEPKYFPDEVEWLENYVSKFTDRIALEIDGELVAVGILDDEAYLHCLINPICDRPFLRARHIKKSMLPYFKKRYNTLYTELMKSNKKSIKLAKYVGFDVLPPTTNKPSRLAAMMRK